METIQQILVYLSLVLAVGWLVGKYVLPKSLISRKTKASKTCGQEHCNCH